MDATADDDIAVMKKPEQDAIDAYLAALLASGDGRNGLKNKWRKLGSDLYFRNTNTADAFYALPQEKVRATLLRPKV